MAFAGTKEDAKTETSPSPLFYHRFNRKFDQRMKQLLQDHSTGLANDTCADWQISRREAKDSSEKTTPLSRRPRLAVAKGTITAYSHAFPRSKRPIARRKLFPNDVSPIAQTASAAKPPENDASLSSLSQMANDLRTMFAKMPKAPRAEGVKLETRRTPEKHPSPKPVPPGYSAFPRISASSTPRRQPVPPSDTARSKSQHRPKASSRRGKEPVDMTGFQQFFAQFHQKSRNLLQQLEANVLGK